MLFSATRYIAGRNAIQTIYWLAAKDSGDIKFLKYNRTCVFEKKKNGQKNVDEVYMLR